MNSASRLTRSPSYKWIVAGMAFFAVFAAIGFGRFAYSGLLPSMQKSLGLSDTATGALASWNLVGYMVMSLVGGLLAARFGARAIVTIGLLITALGLFLTGLSGSLTTAAAARFLTGMGNGMVMVPAIALMAAWFDARQRGLGTGIVPAGGPLALVLLGPLVPRILGTNGVDHWRFAWYLLAGITAIIGVVALVVLRDRPHEETPRAQPKKTGFADFKFILSSRSAWHLGFVYFLGGFAMLIFITFFQKRLTADLGYSTAAAGNLFLVVGAAGVAAGVIWGGISDRVGRGKALAVNLVMQAVAAAIFSMWTTTPTLIIASLLYGISTWSLPSLIGAQCGDIFGATLASASLGFTFVFAGAGETLGPLVGGSMEQHFSSLGPSLALSSGLFFLAGVAALGLRDVRRGSKEDVCALDSTLAAD